MKLQTIALLMLVLFHAATAWAVAVPVAQCGDHVETAMHDMADGHANMQHEMQADAASDCCDEMNSFNCQLHCAGAVTGLTLTTSPVADSPVHAESPTSRLGRRLPPHSRSLLRPPQPLI